MQVARVAIADRNADVDRLLDYQLSPLAGQPGNRVLVPLGKRKVQGIIVEVLGHSTVLQLKPVLRIIDETTLPDELIDLAHWLSLHSACSLGAALAAILPPVGTAAPRRGWQLNPAAAVNNLPEKQRWVKELQQDGIARSKAEICRQLGISSSPVDSLIAKGVLTEVSLAPDFPHWPLSPVESLNTDQLQAIASIEELTAGLTRPGKFLLQGVAGSGKTEVYLRLAKKVVARGRQVLVMVPEIALTAQLVARFRMAFENRVAVLHSGMAAGVRADCWRSIAAGSFPVVVGTRSAVFAPLDRLGLIVVDEEHEPAYKQEETPRYHAREVALHRAAAAGATVVLGSATPSLEASYWTAAGNFVRLCLPHRIHNHRPATILIDMRKELQAGNRSVFSRQLQDALDAVLARGEQALLFLNRRGVAPTVLCRNCGFRYLCQNCSTGLTLHRQGRLRCHYCGAAAVLPRFCPRCGSSYLKELGLGTQKLEDYLRHRYPAHSILRLDRDSVASAVQKEKLLHDFYRQKAKILVGTQMIAKGLDFPNVTLVGVVLADLSLAMSDFRAAERTFQLVTQAAGRAGRGEKPGRVIIQTYQPEHYSLRFALAGDYQGFYAYETKIRRRAQLPPFVQLSRIVVTATTVEKLDRQVGAIQPLIERGNHWAVMYSGPPPLEKLKGWHRWHILLRHHNQAGVYKALLNLRRKVTKVDRCRIVIDHKPYNFM